MATEQKLPIFIDDIADPAHRERCRLHQRIAFDMNAHEQEQAYKGHMEYARWLFASLLAIHGGAIYAVNGLRTSVPPEKSGFLINAAAFSLGGVFLTLLAGFFAWVNLQAAEILYRRRARPEMLYQLDDVPEGSGKWVDRLLYAAAAFGILSGLSFAVAASLVVVGLKHL